MRFFTGCKVEFYNPLQVNPEDLDRWWKLYEPNHSVSKNDFLKRFRQFDRFVFFREARTGRIVGGSGFKIRAYELKAGKKIDTIYVGQAFIEPKFRGRKLQAIAYSRVVLACKIKHPIRQIWFWVDALSYKVYLILGNHVLVHYPSPFWPTPPWVEELRNQIGEENYPGMYNPQTGVVKKPERRLKAWIAKVNGQDLNNPKIKFYVEQNPGYETGDGLLCVFPGSMKNVLNLVKLVILRKKRGKSENKKIIDQAL